MYRIWSLAAHVYGTMSVASESSSTESDTNDVTDPAASEDGLSTSNESEASADEADDFLLILFVSAGDGMNSAILSMNVPYILFDLIDMVQINVWLRESNIDKLHYYKSGSNNVEYTTTIIFYYEKYQPGSPMYNWVLMKTSRNTLTIVDWKPPNEFYIEYTTKGFRPSTDLVLLSDTIIIPIPSTDYWNINQETDRKAWLYLAWEYGKTTYFNWPRRCLVPDDFIGGIQQQDIFKDMTKPFGHYCIPREKVYDVMESYTRSEWVLTPDVRCLQKHADTRANGHFAVNIDTIEREATLFADATPGLRNKIAKQWLDILVENNRLYNSTLLPVYLCNILAVCHKSITEDDIPASLKKLFKTKLEIFFPKMID